MGKPVIGIINTWSEMSPCHAHLRDRAEAVKRGVWQAGGYPVELPALSVGEVMVKPTTMLYRNFLAMEVEELLRCLTQTPPKKNSRWFFILYKTLKHCTSSSLRYR